MSQTRMPSADPTRSSLWAGRVFTTVTFGLAMLGMIAALFELSSDIVLGFVIAAAGVYFVGAILLYMRRDYIMMLFGCGWPLFLPKVDELQLAHRQRAFAATFATFTSVFSLGMGVHFGMMLTQMNRGDEVVGLLPSEPEAMIIILAVILFFLSIAPQAYLAWTLKPLEGEEPA